MSDEIRRFIDKSSDIKLKRYKIYQISDRISRFIHKRLNKYRISYATLLFDNSFVRD